MKSIFYISGILCLLLLGSCGSDTIQETETPDDDFFWEDLFAKTLEDYSSNFQKIIASEERSFRGVDLRMSPAEVRGVELATQVETEGNIIRYVEEFSLHENVDIEYYFSENNQQLNEIIVTYYGSSLARRDSLWLEFVEYYDDKLNTHKKRNREVYWLTETKDTLTLLKVGNKRHPNLMLSVR
ncbi:MAG: hypothetical protein GY827_02090 [Cytophagales bacterium]|nr:hypothetical protein [Cytophagales bacterium]